MLLDDAINIYGVHYLDPSRCDPDLRELGHKDENTLSGDWLVVQK
jgi:hypothetical protein